MKRFLSMILVLVMLLPPAPLPARAAVTSDIRAAVSESYQQLAAQTDPGESTYDGTFQLLNHALFGKGEDLTLGQEDAFTGLVVQANLFREAYLSCIASALQYLDVHSEENLYMDIYYYWYEHKTAFGSNLYSDNTFSEDSKKGYLVKTTRYTGPLNSFDEAMILLGGSINCRVELSRVPSEGNADAYSIRLTLVDDFNFDGEYTSDDAGLAKVLTWFGKLLQIGAVVREFRLEASAECSVTVPNYCSHQSANFRWDVQNRRFSAVSGNGLTVNSAEWIQETVYATGEPADPYFLLESAVILNHDFPWVLELRMKGSSQMYMGPTSNIGSGLPFLIKGWRLFAGGESFRYTEGDQNNLLGRHQYGVNIRELGYDSKTMYTWRLENRLDGNGNNMVYLLVDGEEAGPLNDYYKNLGGSNYAQNTRSDWFNGTDIHIRYLFNQSYTFSNDMEIEYLQIWENGEGNAPVSYVTSQTVAPAPGVQGYTQHTCTKCGASWKDSFVDALKGGIAGSWETDFTLSAAELGVNTEDARLRCTLTFGTDGQVSAAWKAIELTAFREFYHTLFVNAYYACAYGAGMTDIAQVEQACMEANGMGVSDYIYSFLDSFDMGALFTPAPASGAYVAGNGRLYTNLPILGNASDPEVGNDFVLEGETLKWNAASYGQPDYTFLCTRK